MKSLVSYLSLSYKSEKIKLYISAILEEEEVVEKEEEGKEGGEGI